MGAKGWNKKGPNATTPRRGPMTLRQQAALEKQGDTKSIINASSETMLKLDHLKSIASWAATEARIPQLSAFYGRRYAATAEAAGVPPDPTLFYCQRCESILEPGTNCTVRLEPSKATRRRRKHHKNPNNPPPPPPQNYIVYSCKVCSHRNAMRGTPKVYVKEMCSSSKAKVQRTSTSKPSSEPVDITFSNPIDPVISLVSGESGKGESSNKPLLSTPLPGESEPNKPLTAATPLPLTLLESKKWRRRSGAKKTAKRGASSSEADGSEKSVAASSKRRKKSGMSLKEIAERDDRGVGLKFDL